MKVDLWSVLEQFFVYKTEHAVFECTVFDSVFSNCAAPWQQFKHAKHGKLVKIVCFFLRSRDAYNRMNPHEKLQIPAFLKAVYIKTISNTFYTLNSQLFFCQLVVGAILFENKTQRQRQTNTASVLDALLCARQIWYLQFFLTATRKQKSKAVEQGFYICGGLFIISLGAEKTCHVIANNQACQDTWSSHVFSSYLK